MSACRGRLTPRRNQSAMRAEASSWLVVTRSSSGPSRGPPSMRDRSLPWLSEKEMAPVHGVPMVGSYRNSQSPPSITVRWVLTWPRAAVGSSNSSGTQRRSSTQARATHHTEGRPSSPEAQAQPEASRPPPP